ncbi:E3 SUMO-protein ligase ZBED1-like [Watersipora subatra]|uniref:E3 SUMO-protein ligase ZBED1-like n=1 Tax=Watersipora subatra TaxID=2589382 RepID=UPI00355B6B62
MAGNYSVTVVLDSDADDTFDDHKLHESMPSASSTQLGQTSELSTGSRRSAVWAFFTISDVSNKNWVTCDLCKKGVKTTDSSTSNLFQHLQIHHFKEYMTVTPKNATRNRKRKSQDTSQSLSSQPTLTSMLPYNRNSEKHTFLTGLVTNYLISGSIPIYTVEKDSFKKLLKGLDPRYQCPGRNHFSKIAIPEKFIQEKSAITEALKNVTSCSLTTDGWSSLAKDPYMSLTINYIDTDWTLVNKCLATSYLPVSHTADNISNFVGATLSEYNLYKEKVVSITTDSAANMNAACRELKLTRLGCFGHYLHNGMTKALNRYEQITNMITSVRKITSVFSYSFQFQRKLQHLQKELKLLENKLINDVKTRWGSTLKMLASVKDQMPGIAKLFVDDRKYRHYLLSFSQTDLLSEVVNALKPYESLTDILSGELMVTSSSIVPTLIYLKELCGDDCDDDVNDGDNNDEDKEGSEQFDATATPTASDIRRLVWKYVKKQYDNQDVNNMLAISTFLDRRYEYQPPMMFKWPTFEQVKDMVSQQIVNLMKDQSTSSVVALPKVQKKSLATILLKKKPTPVAEKAVDDPDRAARHEIEFFLSMECPPEMEVNIWWSTHQHEFKNLSSIARKVMCVNATSVSSERLFSIAGHIVSKKRTTRESTEGSIDNVAYDQPCIQKPTIHNSYIGEGCMSKISNHLVQYNSAIVSGALVIVLVQVAGALLTIVFYKLVKDQESKGNNWYKSSSEQRTISSNKKLYPREVRKRYAYFDDDLEDQWQTAV